MIKGENIYIRPLTINDVNQLHLFQTENAGFFEKYAMERTEQFYTLDYQSSLINKWENDAETDGEYHFGIFKMNQHQLVGKINLFQVLRGSLQSAFIGYFLDKSQNGKGYATEAVKLITLFAFDTLKLHRIEAGVMPSNPASIRVLEKAGYHKEGIAVKNVRINGKWEDHQVLAIINPND
ncbi:[ribosomal protein S5]-alanine N-acetyltransferase [Cytobacillus horneckiae]|uniref:N-acetyltransferase n=1 Tax=Cytobacillus horneckiae TaxID=549687 RepID=A0A2N0ZE13_9BACI|nr:GNAT family protein [Cytobacillus horneckiae]MBN6888976.1 GNAT family N-acetyltransferase [Cytobacillus horneckiae]MCM3180835.1 GNAT family N-acetyltransferase [Cytobacillus horneckiae]MEC1157457.1 GNAT family protein [Cytobacillus horneckiae]MED2939406.1 GNAT family protein [Cytobacillus horneckiae]PKG27746.1 N-acetyltransferase [Cytobacillus horneckiae]